MGLTCDGLILWRIHFRSSPERVYGMLANDDQRMRFWAKRCTSHEGKILFEFSNGQILLSEILLQDPPNRFVIRYFGGSLVHFELKSDGAGGTELELRESEIPEAERLENLAGWVSLLLTLKAAVDFGIDLRNGCGRTWEEGYIDV